MEVKQMHNLYEGVKKAMFGEDKAAEPEVKPIKENEPEHEMEELGAGAPPAPETPGGEAEEEQEEVGLEEVHQALGDLVAALEKGEPVDIEKLKAVHAMVGDMVEDTVEDEEVEGGEEPGEAEPELGEAKKKLKS
jgi:cytochrome c556